MELFVSDLDASASFYEQVLGFTPRRTALDYVSLRRGDVVLGLGPIAKLPEGGNGPGFTQQRLRADRGAGVEIVLEVDGLDELLALNSRCQAHGVTVEDLQMRSWGLRDFRIVDPDGYYLRLTHGDARDSHSEGGQDTA